MYKRQGKYKSIEDIKNLVVANIDGKMIRLYDVAEVKDGWAEETVSADINASAGVLIACLLYTSFGVINQRLKFSQLIQIVMHIIHR